MCILKILIFFICTPTGLRLLWPPFWRFTWSVRASLSVIAYAWFPTAPDFATWAHASPPTAEWESALMQCLPWLRYHVQPAFTSAATQQQWHESLWVSRQQKLNHFQMYSLLIQWSWSPSALQHLTDMRTSAVTHSTSAWFRHEACEVHHPQVAAMRPTEMSFIITAAAECQRLLMAVHLQQLRPRFYPVTITTTMLWTARHVGSSIGRHTTSNCSTFRFCMCGCRHLGSRALVVLTKQ